MTTHEKSKTTKAGKEVLPAPIDTDFDDWEVAMKRVKTAIAVRRATREARKSKPIKYSMPTIRDLSKSSNEG